MLNKVLGIVAGVLLIDHDVRHTQFQQVPYHRIFIMLFLELNAPDAILENINFQVRDWNIASNDDVWRNYTLIFYLYNINILIFIGIACILQYASHIEASKSPRFCLCMARNCIASSIHGSNPRNKQSTEWKSKR